MITTVPQQEVTLDAQDKDVAQKVAEHEWTAIGVDDHDPALVCNIGLMTSTKPPKIIILAFRSVSRVI